jgi:hypothetical protein
MAREFKSDKLEIKADGMFPVERVLAVNKAGHTVRLHRDYHDVKFFHRFKADGFIFPDEYQSEAQKKELEGIIQSRLSQSQAARVSRGAMSPEGRQRYDNMAVYQKVVGDAMMRFAETYEARHGKPTPPPITPTTAVADAHVPPPVERKPGEKR